MVTLVTSIIEVITARRTQRKTVKILNSNYQRHSKLILKRLDELLAED